MAELNQKLHYKLKGVTEEITCYTTLAEVQNQGMPLKLSGVNCYAKYGSINDTYATNMKYKPGGGIEYRILSRASIPYGEQAYTTPGTYTFTVPNGITKVKVAMCGGGGAGMQGGTSSSFGTYLSASTNTNTGNRNEAIGYKLSFTEVRENTYGVGYGWGGKSLFGSLYFKRSNFSAATLTVAPNEVISVVVGQFGMAGTGANAGGVGFVLIAWGGDIT